MLKAGDYVKDQPNNNNTNGKAKYLHNKYQDNWNQHYVIMKFNLYHINNFW